MTDDKENPFAAHGAFFMWALPGGRALFIGAVIAAPR